MKQDNLSKMNLAEAAPNKIVRVVSIDAGLGLRSRLIGMGLAPDAIVKILDNRRGHVIIAIGSGFGRVIALSRGIASKILVEEVSQQSMQ